MLQGKLQKLLRRNATAICAGLVGAVLLAAMPVDGAWAAGCKEAKSKTACTAASCSWVKAHTRKSGKKISAYCRKKSLKKKKKAS